MRIYETSDVGFYVEKSECWDSCCSYRKNKTWSHQRMQPVKSINYYRDVEGSRILEMTRRDLYLGKKPKSRINPWACLPIYYATGVRFIKISQAGPGGFKCSEFPMNLKEARAKVLELERLEEEKAKKEYFDKIYKMLCNEAARKKSKMKPKNDKQRKK